MIMFTDSDLLYLSIPNGRQLLGEQLDSLTIKELQQLEQQLDSSLKHIRSRKVNKLGLNLLFGAQLIWLFVDVLVSYYIIVLFYFGTESAHVRFNFRASEKGQLHSRFPCISHSGCVTQVTSENHCYGHTSRIWE
jgi:hypothetical protein